MTLLTDYLIMAQCLYFFVVLGRTGVAASSARHLFGWAFLFTAVAGFAGGTVHGFRPLLSQGLEDGLWLATLHATGLMSFCFSLAVVRAVVAPRWHGLLAVLLAIKLLGYLAWVSMDPQFIRVIVDYGLGLLLVLALMLYSLCVRRQGHERYFLAAIGVSVVGAGVQASGFSLHEHFNNNDLFHLIQLVGFYLFYRGACSLEDRVS